MSAVHGDGGGGDGGAGGDVGATPCHTGMPSSEEVHV